MRDVDKVFMDEIQRENYVRALTDDFSVVDEMFTGIVVGAVYGSLTSYKRAQISSTFKELAEKHGFRSSDVRFLTGTSAASRAMNGLGLKQQTFCIRITSDKNARSHMSHMNALIKDLKKSDAYVKYNLQNPRVCPNYTKYEDDHGVIGFEVPALL